MKQWYVVNTKPHCEVLAQESLQRLGVEVFLPKILEQRMIRRKLHATTTPLFPSYLFVRCEMPLQQRAVSYAVGVRKLVSFGSGPAKVDESMIAAIKSRGHNGVVTLVQESFTPGQVVRINDGLLYGLDAIFQKRMSGSERAVVLLKAISYQATVIVDMQDVVNI